MIGVLSRPGQASVVEEFFELFKTPWEFYREGQRYDVILTTVTEPPAVSARLLLVFGPDEKTTDAFHGTAPRGDAPAGLTLEYRGAGLPIYSQLSTFAGESTAAPILTSRQGPGGVRIQTDDVVVVRVGYDLFEEARFLLCIGQPAENAHIPALDMHIGMLRHCILESGIQLLEIPPTPAGHPFFACLTHDIDFVGIRNHRFDHTMWGFLYRSTVGAVQSFVRGRIAFSRLLRIWQAVASLPFVYLGWARDFWEPFAWYLNVEHDLPTTYFLIPFKGRPGEHVPGRHGAHRATAYDIGDLPAQTATLMKAGCELGVHGIDAWHSVPKGRDELTRLTAVTGEVSPGIRMHWLLSDRNTPLVLEDAGYAYDSSAGYNETVGYRNGTTQAFRPLGARSLMELPLHIQDGALFYRLRLNLSEPEAQKRCDALIGHARTAGGALTVVWHDRSHGPERFWGAFYARLVGTLKASGGRFGTAAQVVTWFRQRRQVRFERDDAAATGVRLRYDGEEIVPGLRIRLHGTDPDSRPAAAPAQSVSNVVDTSWNGKIAIELDSHLGVISGPRGASTASSKATPERVPFATPTGR